MKTRNRLLALLMAMTLVLTYMPAIAFAAEDEEPSDNNGISGVLEQEQEEFGGDNTVQDNSDVGETVESEDTASEVDDTTTDEENSENPNEDTYRIVVQGLEEGEQILPGETKDISLSVYSNSSDNLLQDVSFVTEKLGETDAFNVTDLGNGNYRIERIGSGYCTLWIQAVNSDGEWLADTDFSLDNIYFDIIFEETDNALFNDDNEYTLSVTGNDLEQYEGKYSLKYSVSVPLDGEITEDGEQVYTTLEDSSKYLTAQGNTVKLKGQELWKAVTDKSERYREVCVTATLLINGYEIEDCKTYMPINEARVDYYTVPDMEMLPDEYEFIDNTCDGFAVGKDYQDGYDFTYPITVEVSQGNDVISLEYDEYGYVVTPKKIGNASLRVSYTDLNGDKKSYEVSVKVMNERFNLYTKVVSGSDYAIVPGESKTFQAEGERLAVVDLNAEYPVSERFTDGLTYKWSFTDESMKNYASLVDHKDGTATVKINEGVTNEQILQDEVPIAIRVELFYQNSSVKHDEYDFYITEEYYEIEADAINEYMPVGRKITLAPKVVYHEMGQTPIQYVTPRYQWDYDTEVVEITDKAGDIVTPGEYVQDPFTIKRLTGEGGFLELHAFEINDSSDVACVDYWLQSVQDITTVATIAGIKNKTYTGSAVKQNITITDEDDYELFEGEDYKVTYTNNVNAGTATVTITGLNRYYGTIKKTFKINPKKITPTVVLSKTAFAYNGKAQKPTVTVMDGKKKLAASQYTVTWSKGLKNIGTYTVTIKLKGNYTGSKAVTYKINPKGTVLSKVTAGKKSFTANWKTQATQTTGYQVQYSLKKNFSGAKIVTVGKVGTLKTTVKKLQSKKTYYVRVRTYKTVGKTKYYSGWSTAKTVKVK